MILSHKNKFIYIKTKKTASTSVEIALSKLCGKKDIITPIGKRGKKKREEMGYSTRQNYHMGLKNYELKDYVNLIKLDKRKRFRRHGSAEFVKKNVKSEIWRDYFKFTFERNPFDKAVSFYYFATNKPRPSIDDFMANVSTEHISNWKRYTINDHIEVDFLGKYERLRKDMGKVTSYLGLDEEISLPKAKSAYRPEKSHYREEINEKAKERIKLVCAKEIKKLDYEW